MAHEFFLKYRLLLLSLLLLFENCKADEWGNLREYLNNPVIIASKSDASLMVIIPRENIVYRTPALYGKLKSDAFDQGVYDANDKPLPITPAGVFPSKKAYSTYLKSKITSFINGKNYIVAIHPVYNSNVSQYRMERLHSRTINDNRITNGCINVPGSFYTKYIEPLSDGTKIIILPENRRVNYSSLASNIKDYDYGVNGE